MFQKKMNLLPMSIHVVGCGGTGSRLVPLLVQLIASHPFLKTMTRIFLYDGDIVETKNLSRQNFSPADVGKNKAFCLAARYSKAYGIPVVAIPEYIPIMESSASKRHSSGLQGNSISHMLGRMKSFDPSIMPQEDIAKACSRNAIWISCVDNIDARVSLLNGLALKCISTSGSDTIPGGYFGMEGESFLPVTGPIFIDAGNENTFGQVKICEGVIAGTHDYLQAISFAARQASKADHVPGVTAVCNPFVELYDDEINLTGFPMFMEPISTIEGSFHPPQVEASCADLDQTLAVNAQMAIGILTFLQNIVLNHPVRNSALYYDIHNGNGQDKLDSAWMERSMGFEEGVFASISKNKLSGSQSATLQMLRNNIPDDKLPSARIALLCNALEKYIAEGHARLPSGANAKGMLAFASNMLNIYSGESVRSSDARTQAYGKGFSSVFFHKKLVNLALRDLLMGKTTAATLPEGTISPVVPIIVTAPEGDPDEIAEMNRRKEAALAQLRSSGWSAAAPEDESDPEGEEDEDEDDDNE